MSVWSKPVSYKTMNVTFAGLHGPIRGGGSPSPNIDKKVTFPHFLLSKKEEEKRRKTAQKNRTQQNNRTDAKHSSTYGPIITTPPLGEN